MHGTTPHQLRLQRSGYIDMDESTGFDDTASGQSDTSRPRDSARLLTAGVRALSARVRVDARADSQPKANPCLQLKQASSQAAAQAAEQRLRAQQACASAGHRVGDRCREFEQACRRALASICRPPTLQCTRPCGAVEAFERALRRCWLGVQERWPPCGAGGCDGGCLPRVMERRTWPRGRRQTDPGPAGAAAASPERRASQAAAVTTPLVATPNSAGFPMTPVKTPSKVVRVQTASELPDDIAALKAQVIELQEDLKRSEARSVAYAAALRWAAAADQARHMEEQEPEQLRKEAARLRQSAESSAACGGGGEVGGGGEAGGADGGIARSSMVTLDMFIIVMFGNIFSLSLDSRFFSLLMRPCT
mgnify:CR=1 FL=1